MEPTIILLLAIIITVTLFVVAWNMATERGRSPWLFLLLGIAVNPLASIILLLILGNKKG